jgi:hypothetical protein
VFIANEYVSYIDDLVEDFNKVQTMMLSEEPSTAQSIFTHLTKILLLTCSSCYEQKLQNAYNNYAQREAERYTDKPHYFDIYKDKKDNSVYQKFSFGRIESPDDNNQLPEIKNLLQPLKFFGEKFRDKILSEIKEDSELEKAAKAFQEIFAIRNLLAHQTFIELNSSSIRGKSFMDIKIMHDDAIKFVDYLIAKFT